MKQWGKWIAFGLSAFVFGFGGAYLAGELGIGGATYSSLADSGKEIVDTILPEDTPVPTWPKPLDKEAYDEALLALADYLPPQPQTITIPATATSATTTKVVTPPSPLKHSSSTNVTITDKQWPPAAPYPHGDAILPFKRIVAYYGNFYSKYMGILGEYPREDVLTRLREVSSEWEAADPDTPVLPAIEYIAMVAQAAPGADGMYRAAMPDEEIDTAYDMAGEIGGIMILDLQVGLSTIERELPQFEEYLKRPDVHLAIDPEFSMKYGDRPGTAIGTYNAKDINYVINYLAELVRQYELPPKVLIVHRFTQDMMTNYQDIQPQPEVQVVINMDGWGSKDLKRGTYGHVVAPEPVQFTGVKLFYKNDLKPPSTGLLTPHEVIDLHPAPIYVQYQ